MTETLTIRTATRADLGRVDALLGRSYPALLKADYPPSVMVTAIPLLARAQPRLLASGSYFVAEDQEGEILAAGGWSVKPWIIGGRPDFGHIRHVATDPRHVRKGIGRRLMTHAIARAEAEGIVQLECLSTLTAVPFYRALGFQEIGPFNACFTPGIDFPAVRMRRWRNQDIPSPFS